MGRNQIKGSDSNQYQFYCERHPLPFWKVPSCPQGLPHVCKLKSFHSYFLSSHVSSEILGSATNACPRPNVSRHKSMHHSSCVNIKGHGQQQLHFFYTGEHNADEECPTAVRTGVTSRTSSWTLNPSLGFLYFVLHTSRAPSSIRKKHLQGKATPLLSLTPTPAIIPGLVSLS